MNIPQWYVSGPHSGDYYLLLDEQSEHIFAARLAEHMRAAGGIRDESTDAAITSLLEMWIDDTNSVWYLFKAACPPS